VETKNKTTKKTAKRTPKKEVKEQPKKISKTWEAVLRNRGTGEILDMRAVLK